MQKFKENFERILDSKMRFPDTLSVKKIDVVSTVLGSNGSDNSVIVLEIKPYGKNV